MLCEYIHDAYKHGLLGTTENLVKRVNDSNATLVSPEENILQWDEDLVKPTVESDLCHIVLYSDISKASHFLLKVDPQRAGSPRRTFQTCLGNKTSRSFVIRLTKWIVWSEQGGVARALCVLHAMDYTCWKDLPDGIPQICQEVFSSTEFATAIVGV